jgi:hypothetical protein
MRHNPQEWVGFVMSQRNPQTPKDTKFHENLKFQEFPFVSLVK